MKQPRLNYSEGGWFAVPIGNQFAIGRIVRASSRGRVLFGYFFGPALSTAPTEDEMNKLGTSRPVMRSKFGDLELISGKWKIVKNTKNWERSKWPMPKFGRTDSDGNCWEARYDENDPNSLIEERPSTPEQIATLPKDSLMGAGFVEKRLTRLLLGPAG